ncbi:unnamed protein product [Ectocarpus sp. CCAP 1310/34]|nr:unnamed protein product [Ectocarpus sp. CCAP 1310/34]
MFRKSRGPPVNSSARSNTSDNDTNGSNGDAAAVVDDDLTVSLKGRQAAAAKTKTTKPRRVTLPAVSWSMSW